MELLRGMRSDPDEGRNTRPRRTVTELLDAAAELRMEHRRQAEAEAAAREAVRQRQRELAGCGAWMNWPRTRRLLGPRPRC
jgi:hypothetical protein